MNTIVLATDGSPSAEQATATAIELARVADAPLHVVTAWSVPASAFGYAPYTVVPELAEAERDKAKETVDRVVDQARAAGLSVSGEIREGFAVEEICAAADEVGASLIAVGAHGWGALKRLVFGSVSTGLLHEAPCPVLVVRGDAAADDTEDRHAAATAA